jgi:putative spermidine/putrescine transport system permease protein
MSKRAFVRLCFVPLAVLVTAFFVLPMARLVLIGASGDQGLRAYAAILLDPRYRATLLNTVSLAAATTIASLVVATISGLFLQRHRFLGHSLLVAMLTFPLAFPGVVVGFMIILLAGRQGLLGEVTLHLFGTKEVFAYSLQGLFLGYLYFSIPRVILTIMAAVEKLDPSLEEAARTLGASPWRVVRDVILPALAPALIASGAIAFATAMGAFGTAFTPRHRRRRFADADLYRIHLVREHCAGRRTFGRTGPCDLGNSGAGPQLWRHQHCGRGMIGCAIA